MTAPLDLATMSDRLLAFLRGDLGVNEPGLGPDTPLVTNGLIDSAGLMRLAAFVERETGLIIPDADVNVGHFDTVRQIVAYLGGRG